MAKKVDSGNGSDCDDKQTSITIVDSSYSDYSRKFARLARSKPRRNRDLKTLTVLPPGPLHRLSTSHDLRRAHISTSQFDGGDVYKEERGRASIVLSASLTWNCRRSSLPVSRGEALYMDRAKQQLCSYEAQSFRHFLGR